MTNEGGSEFSLPAVAVRMRPRLDRERMRRERVADRLRLDERSRRVIVHASSDKPHEMIFDHVFASRTSQHRLYTGCQLQRSVKAVARGERLRSCVIAYGQSGSGKTYSLYGDEESPAIVQHAARDVFKVVDYARGPEEIDVRMSFVEICNDRLHDLLDPTKTDLHVRDTKCTARVEGLSEHVVSSTGDVMRLVKGGLSRTSKHAIRSSFENNFTHTVLGLKIIRHPRKEEERVWEGHLEFVDLAGADKTGDVISQQSTVEARKSSLSLLSLAQVVIALVHKGTHDHGFIPYRNSVLTRLLKGNLNGSCRTLILVCITPLFANLRDTLNSLKFAVSAKSRDHSLRSREHFKSLSFSHQVPPFKQSYSARSRCNGSDEDRLRSRALLPGQPTDETTTEDETTTRTATSCASHLAESSFADRVVDESTIGNFVMPGGDGVPDTAMEALMFAEAARRLGRDVGNYILYLAEKGMKPEQFADTARKSGMSLVELAEYTASAGIHPMEFARHYGVLTDRCPTATSATGAVRASYISDSSLQDLLDYGSTLQRGVACQDRRVGDKIYRGVFTGADGALFFMEALEGVSTVSEAEQVGAKLMLLGVISPVGAHCQFIASPRHLYCFSYEETVCDRVLERANDPSHQTVKQNTRTTACIIL
ncbi:uncharacterized protein LOC134184413 [Corticium candelabrum]|uniref:uncharacterized protein LOC134184413 n=1 Tax=Corticium candelabrum TaxID=121492 RepID=UPI002E33C337|nr:uncharacterized protein LOC134184413 [Corticium candelabrum]